ncbi:broad specificity phosphatase PhoE [Nocardia transvalensis]|uniref:Broad specificity phosphatase PhoE n=2 Tax=Nocardia transvalensis TaxID=37333 RepID=A0A7W9UJ68_9NOCA|nr:broad specificity phosphatase PhoE [Nocardia transvalensis]
MSDPDHLDSASAPIPPASPVLSDSGSPAATARGEDLDAGATGAESAREPAAPRSESEPESGADSGATRSLPAHVASDTETIVHVMRHGEVHNPKGILYGRLPGFSLSVSGRSQATAVARSLADHDISLVVASPLQRAQETAEPIAVQHGVVVRTDDNLIEAGNTFEGLRVSVGDGALRKPRHWWKLRDPFTPSWGEPYLQIAHRMLAAVNKARVEAAGHEAVLVSHQLPVWTLRRFLEGKRLWHDPRNRQCSLASLTSLVYQGDTLIDIVYSEPAGESDPRVTGA